MIDLSVSVRNALTVIEIEIVASAQRLNSRALRRPEVIITHDVVDR